MSWARNTFWLLAAFFVGRQSAQSGWHEFALQQVAIVLFAIVFVAAWVVIEKLERRVKSKGRGR